MKILTEGLRGLSKVYGLMRVQGNVYYENVYLDFGARTITWQNATSVFRTRLEATGSDVDEMKPVFISGSRFFALVSSTDELEYDGEFFVSNGNRFRLETLNDEVTFPLSTYDDWKETTLNFTPELQRHLDLAVDYIEKDANSPFSALFFTNGKMVALNRQRFYIVDVSSSTQEDLVLPFEMLRLINTMNITGSAVLRVRKTTSSDILELEYGQSTIRMAGSSEYRLPVDIFSDAFRSTYTFDEYVTLDSSAMLSALNFLNTYLSDRRLSYCNVTAHTLDENGTPLAEPYMGLEFSYGTDIVRYRVPILDTYNAAEMNGKQFCMYLSVLKQAFSTLSANGAQKIMMRYRDRSVVVYFSNAEEDDGMFILHVTISEEG